MSSVGRRSDLTSLAGKSFTFGSESSTSGRLMPQHFLTEAGVQTTDFAGEPGYSGSHDATAKLVMRVWKMRSNGKRKMRKIKGR